MFRDSLLPWTAALAVVAASLPAQDQTRFQDVTASSGIQFTHAGRIDEMAGGLCFLDYDNDGDEDLFVTARGGSNRLYRNAGNGTFTDVSQAAGVGETMETMGAYAQDFDGDGWLDLMVLARSNFRVYHNRGDGTFANVTARSNLARMPWPVSATFADYDHDGDLDAYVGQYIGEGFFPNFEGHPNLLLRNDGAMTFTNVAVAAGATGEERVWDPRGFWKVTGSCTLSVLFHDYDNDGWADIFVGNDFGPFVIPNQLFRNEGNGRFTEVSRSANFRIPEFNMGLCTADVNGDGNLDIYTSNFGQNHLLINDGRGRYTDIASNWGASEARSNGLFLVSWSAMFTDADLDGLIDLYVSNGFVNADPSMRADPDAPSRLLMHRGNRYEILPTNAFPWDLGHGRGAACADIDGDGDEDIVQLNNRQPLKVFRNDSITPNNAALLDLRGTLSDRDAAGARLDIRSPQRRQVVENARGGSYGSGNGSRVVRGLGIDVEIDELTVTWPSGVVSRRFAVPANVPQEIVEPRVTLRSLGRWFPLGTDYVEVPVEVHNHAGYAQEVAFTCALVYQGRRYAFPALHFPTTIGGGATTTVPVYLPISQAAQALGRQLGVWYQIGVIDRDGGRDELEQPVR